MKFNLLCLERNTYKALAKLRRKLRKPVRIGALEEPGARGFRVRGAGVE